MQGWKWRQGFRGYLLIVRRRLQRRLLANMPWRQSLVRSTVPRAPGSVAAVATSATVRVTDLMLVVISTRTRQQLLLPQLVMLEHKHRSRAAICS
jgi:hypothetical protein